MRVCHLCALEFHRPCTDCVVRFFCPFGSQGDDAGVLAYELPKVGRTVRLRRATVHRLAIARHHWGLGLLFSFTFLEARVALHSRQAHTVGHVPRPAFVLAALSVVLPHAALPRRAPIICVPSRHHLQRTRQVCARAVFACAAPNRAGTLRAHLKPRCFFDLLVLVHIARVLTLVLLPCHGSGREVFQDDQARRYGSVRALLAICAANRAD